MDILEPILERIAAKTAFALACVIQATGSTPQKAGAKALFDASGGVEGTLGGGCLEAESRRRALRGLDEGKAFAFDLKLDEVDGWDDGLVCGGKVRILIDPDARRNTETYRAVLAAVSRRERGVLLTVVRHPGRLPGSAQWLPEADLETTKLVPDAGAIRTLLQEGRAGVVEDAAQGIEVFVEPVLPKPQLVIAGAGHIGKATAHFAARLGFEVTVIDDRAVFANAKHIPDAHRTVCGDIAGELQAFSLSAETYVVIVTRGHRHDAKALAACVRRPLAYLGLIGSRRKSLLLRRRLVEEGMATEEEVARVISPIGLDIGGRSVEEIALSIAAQLVAVRRKHAFDAPALDAKA